MSCIAFSLLLVLNIYASVANGQILKRNVDYIFPNVYHYTQKLDHFNPTVDTTFQQRYFLSSQYWKKGSGPIFFYSGNEGDIVSFINNTGFMWDITPMFQAMVVFAEHRYYGKSKPFGDIDPNVNTTSKFAQLTAEQALADYAVLIQHLKQNISGAEDSAVITFGGSYGGMLSAWFRIKYPHIVDGAIAASAPINYFPGHTPCEAYNQVATNDFLSTPNGPQCVKNIRNAWPLIQSTAKQSKGLEILSDVFHTCKPLSSADELIEWIQSCWGNIVMVDYPYAANFLNPLPAWPVNVTCDQLSTPLKDMNLLKAMYKAINVYANYTGQASCLDTSSTLSGGLATGLWDYQTCTFMVMPFCTDGVHDMFPVSKWSYEEFVKDCQKKYGVTPRPNWTILNFGGLDLKAASNIVFSNGELDPWHVGGVLENVSDSVIAIKMWGAAHHLDLRHHNEKDPASVTECRMKEITHIFNWITEKNKRLYGIN